MNMSWCQLTPTGHFAVVQAILDRLKELGTHLERLSNLFTRTLGQAVANLV